MARIRLHEQPHYEFTYQITIQVGHINFRGHLAHDSIVRILEEARANLFHTLGLGELNLGDGRTGVIAGDMVVNYKGEGFMYETLRVESHIGEISSGGFRLFHRIGRDGHLVTLAEVGLFGFDYKSRAVALIPETFNKALEEYRQGITSRHEATVTRKGA
jgi:acyl-CoA thioester hydrolase